MYFYCDLLNRNVYSGNCPKCMFYLLNECPIEFEEIVCEVNDDDND